jgi:hypothetical protein
MRKEMRPGAAPADAIASELTDEERRTIAEIAYARFERRGRQDGHALEDWLAAEAQVMRERERARQRPQRSRSHLPSSF